MVLLVVASNNRILLEAAEEYTGRLQQLESMDQAQVLSTAEAAVVGREEAQE